MPIGDTVCVEPVIGAVIAEVVKETPFHSGSLRIRMNVSKGVQRTPFVMVRETSAGIPLFPEVSCAV